MPRTLLLLAIAAPALGGCVRTAVGVVTLPVRAVGYGYDKMTTSQAEADRNRGRHERKAEERAEKEQRKAERAARRDQARGIDAGY